MNTCFYTQRNVCNATTNRNQSNTITHPRETYSKRLKDHRTACRRMPTETELIAERLRKLHALREQGIEPYPYRFDRSHTSHDIHVRFQGTPPGTHTTTTAAVAGRIMALRRMGKATFIHLRDGHGKIQTYAAEDRLGATYAQLKLYDIGDFVGITGLIFTTKTGELTIDAQSIVLLAKSIRPLPDKWSGLKDIEIRYRKRHLDLMMNPVIHQTFRQRSNIIQSLRKTLEHHQFLEVETPVLQSIYGGANARPFETTLNALKQKMYLRISPELHLKRLLVGGFERVFEIARDFRNEDIDKSHNPEFSMVECYQAYAELIDVMALTEEIITNACLAVHGTTRAAFGDHTIEYQVPWRRLTMTQAIHEYAKIDVKALSDTELFDLRTVYNLEIDGDITRGKMLQALFDDLVEEKLIQPTFITEYPKESSPLCKASQKDPALIDRFELFIAGMEIANAYSELNDPIIQRELLEAQSAALRAGSEEAHPMDDDFIEAMEYGMPPAGGVGIGIDRMVMLLTGNTSIRDVILFPFMKQREE